MEEQSSPLTKGGKKASFASICISASIFLIYKCLWFLDFPLYSLWLLTSFLVNELNKIMLTFTSVYRDMILPFLENNLSTVLSAIESQRTQMDVSVPDPTPRLICVYTELVVSICNSHVLQSCTELANTEPQFLGSWEPRIHFCQPINT